KLPQTGPSKEKRFDKNLLAFGLAITDDNIPIFSEMHPGNENEAKVFSEIVEKLTGRLESLRLPVKDVVLSIDRGMNSEDNIERLVNKMHIIGGLKRNQVGDLWTIPLSAFRELYTTSKRHKVLGYESRRTVFGRSYRIILTYNQETAIRQRARYEKEKQTFLSEAATIQRSLTSKGRGRRPTQQSIVRRLNKLIHNGRESVFKYHIGPDLYSKNGLHIWLNKKAEEKLFGSFGKQAIFTDIEDWNTVEVVKAYTGKAMVEEDFKFLKDRLLISVMPQWHRTDPRIKVHVFLCIVGLTMYRYLLWKLRDTEMSVYELDKALKGIRVGFVTLNGKERKVQQIVEEMRPNAARVFSKLDIGRFVRE
ncbi:MAG: IS1634 family transposase, partial [Candidatus Thermoplasmatota archaeon]